MDTTEVVKYTTCRTPFGRALLAASPRGIIFLGFFASAAERERAWAGMMRFCRPGRLQKEPSGLAATAHNLFLRPAGAGTPPALDLRVTPFQRLVLEQLVTVLPGTTVSYKELACSLKRPSAARAVARALAANPVSWLLPCHRIIRADGELGGYRWGRDRKAAMLAWERDYRRRSGN